MQIDFSGTFHKIAHTSPFVDRVMAATVHSQCDDQRLDVGSELGSCNFQAPVVVALIGVQLGRWWTQPNMLFQDFTGLRQLIKPPLPVRVGGAHRFGHELRRFHWQQYPDIGLTAYAFFGKEDFCTASSTADDEVALADIQLFQSLANPGQDHVFELFPRETFASKCNKLPGPGVVLFPGPGTGAFFMLEFQLVFYDFPQCADGVFFIVQ